MLVVAYINTKKMRNVVRKISLLNVMKIIKCHEKIAELYDVGMSSLWGH